MPQLWDVDPWAMWCGGEGLCGVDQSFVCRCRGVVELITGGLDAGLRLDVGDGVSLWKVDGFCYLGDMLDGDVVLRWRPESGLRGGRFMNTCPF